SRRRHTRFSRDWSSDVCSSDLSIGEDIEFDANMFNLVKRAFLYKPLEWAYEEEVRIVKNISSIPFSYYDGVGRYDKWTKISISRSEEHTSELQSRENIVCRLLL